MSLDNFEDAVTALQRDGKTFMVVQLRTTSVAPDGEDAACFRVEGEFHNDVGNGTFDSAEALAAAVRGYIRDFLDGEFPESEEGS